MILLAFAVLFRPTLIEVSLPPGLAMAVPLAVVILTSAVLASPEARNHAHGDRGAGAAVARRRRGHAHGAAGAGSGRDRATTGASAC